MQRPLKGLTFWPSTRKSRQKSTMQGRPWTLNSGKRCRRSFEPFSTGPRLQTESLLRTWGGKGHDAERIRGELPSPTLYPGYRTICKHGHLRGRPRQARDVALLASVPNTSPSLKPPTSNMTFCGHHESLPGRNRTVPGVSVRLTSLLVIWSLQRILLLFF